MLGGKVKMKIHNATLIAGFICFAGGLYLWLTNDAMTKLFSLSGNLIVAGVFVMIVSLLARINID